jgi:hypothetical protein
MSTLPEWVLRHHGGRLFFHPTADGRSFAILAFRCVFIFFEEGSGEVNTLDLGPGSFPSCSCSEFCNVGSCVHGSILGVLLCGFLGVSPAPSSFWAWRSPVRLSLVDDLGEHLGFAGDELLELEPPSEADFHHDFGDYQDPGPRGHAVPDPDWR